MRIAEEQTIIPTEQSQPYSPIHDNYRFVSPPNASPVADLRWKVSQMDGFNNNNNNNNDASREFKSPTAVPQRLVQASMDSEHFDILGNTIVEMGDNSNNATGLARTHIATHHFSSFERLIFAITDDDVATFDRLGIPIEQVVNFEFDGGTNVLNFAIEQERINMVNHLAQLTKDKPSVRQRLIEHRFGKD